jgi:hypothetical protein
MRGCRILNKFNLQYEYLIPRGARLIQRGCWPSLVKICQNKCPDKYYTEDRQVRENNENCWSGPNGVKIKEERTNRSNRKRGKCRK